MPRALLSVSDTSNLVELAQGLSALGWDLVASGGTRKALEAAGLTIVALERVTGLPEMLGGRVKTLHPAIHAGILARDTEDDLHELREQGFAPIDLVVCNLYPFEAVINQNETDLATAIEHIDIGGVTLLRAAAKNFGRVGVLVDPSDYAGVLAEIQAEGRPSSATRRALALKAFAHTRDYDTAIHAYLLNEADHEPELGESFSLGLRLALPLRYGENPHQKAGFFAEKSAASPLRSVQLGGKELSYNNILDADAAWRTASDFDAQQGACVVIVKHLNPTGIAIAETAAEAFKAALASDPLSAFGGVIALNTAVDMALVEAFGDLFIEVILAPAFEADALEKLRTGRKNCRFLGVKPAPQAKLEHRSVLGGVLIQESDQGDPSNTDWKVVSKRFPTEAEYAALGFAWRAVSHVKSNAIVIAQNGFTVGIGGGLSSRVDATQLALEKAGDAAAGAVLASDAFFPFPDAIELAAAAGVRAIIQPGGALRDQQIIAAADAADIALVLTGVRHFRH